MHVDQQKKNSVLLPPSGKDCPKLVFQMDVSSTNFMLDTFIGGTSFFGWREYKI